LNANIKSLFDSLLPRRTVFSRSGALGGQASVEPPLRAELFSADQMERHGRILAHSHQLAVKFGPDQLLPRLSENERILVECSRVLMETVSANGRLTPAGEWLLDNFYLIDEQIRTAKRHLPKGYSRALPRLSTGLAIGVPRVYDIALEVIAHGDGRVDPESLSRFVAAYQSVIPLQLGELWAIPIMLRLALIENLRRVAVRIAADRIDRNLADSWANQMIKIAEDDPKSLILVIADMARSNPPMTTPFVAEFACRLQGQGPTLVLPLTWIEQLLSESHQTIEQLVQTESQQQAADQVSIGNSIGSLRFLGAMDWREFVESMSIVERTLEQDPGGAYAQMDFATRDRYRQMVEKTARNTRHSEGEVAALAIQLAQTAADTQDGNVRQAHVGYYLVDRGLIQLERSVQARLPPGQALLRALGRFPLFSFIGAISGLTLVFSACMVLNAHANGVRDWDLALLAVLAVLGTSHLAVALVNWLATLVVKPYPLPRMDYSGGIPPHTCTLVVVPTMLASPAGIENLIEALEVRFLANRDEYLHFGLLTDFLDAPQETLPTDEALQALAQAGIEGLNQKYPGANGDYFFLFHRPRRWNEQERVWMGYERKRGKLADLNRLLRGGGQAAFSLVVGELSCLSQVKYVITLDTDTLLPRDSARQFIGTMAHPLNRARYDEAKQRVCEGYGILQPRVSVSLTGSSSRYAKLYSGEPGIDPYTRAVSDVYQDLFQEGSFIGKGIYDVDAFERSLADRFPENRILSHDLLEGCYARSGLLSDVHLYEEYPARYSADVARRHRWIRGDWQLLGWLFSKVPASGDRRQKNPLSGLSQWKIFDNLRRSLIAVALTALLLLGWTAWPQAGFWTGAVIAILLIPTLCASFLGVVRKPADLLLRQHLLAELRVARGHFIHAALMLICLPHEAYYSLDAIIRTLWRLSVSHRRLLEWNPSTECNRTSRSDLPSSFYAMWMAPVLAMAAGGYLSFERPDCLAVAAPILLLWWLSPVITWWISQPLARRQARLSVGQVFFLRRIARKTWSYFDTFVGPEDHWLPPDNCQKYRGPHLAHRTSPTNIGVALLANLTAYDFGYIPAGSLLERTANTLGTMAKMERFRGHFYNWYDTQTLKPLNPVYVSTVDSGNLAGHLLTLRPGLLELPGHPILGPRWLDGLFDTVGILLKAIGDEIPAPLLEFQAELESAMEAPPATLDASWRCLERLTLHAEAFDQSLLAVTQDDLTAWWARNLARQCRTLLEDLLFIAPWASLPAAPAGLGEFPDLSRIPTLREVCDLHLRVWQAVDRGLNETPEMLAWMVKLRPLVQEGSRHAGERIESIESLAMQISDFACMDYDFLFDKSRRLLAIGYNVGDRLRDVSFYDLLASEARLCAFVAIAQGQLPQESWFALGRLLVATGGESILLSWSGSMFEYLMPLLVMPTYDNTLIDQTYRAVVQRQIEYGKQRSVPWGISESGYNTVDADFNYQYRAFGVPGLGLKRGLAEDLVVAPYASVLALMVEPEAACQNLQRLAADGMVGKYGFFEAVDYTPSRQRRGESKVLAGVEF